MGFFRSFTSSLSVSLRIGAPPTVAFTFFLFLAVSAHTGSPFPGDVALAQAVQSRVPEGIQPLLLLVHTLGGRLAVGTYGIGATGVLWALRYRFESFLVFIVLLTALGNEVIKELVGRLRPDPSLVQIHAAAGGAYGFPSGDTLFFTTFFGLFFFFAPNLVSSPRAVFLLRGLCMFLVLLVGPERIALGVHWPSDVLGGYVLGGLILWSLLVLYRRFLSQLVHSRSRD